MVEDFSSAEEMEHEIKEIMENKSCSSEFSFIELFQYSFYIVYLFN